MKLPLFSEPHAQGVSVLLHLRRIRLWAGFVGFACVSAGTALGTVTASLDFDQRLTYIDFLDGAGIGQFEGERDLGNGDTGIGITSWYSDLTGFPDDQAPGGFRNYMDTAYSASAADGAKGMALHSCWFMPGSFLGEQGWVGTTWQSIDWSKVNFDVFEPTHSTDPALPHYQNQTIVFVPYRGYARAHIAPVVNAAARRAREENLRMMFFYDAKPTYDYTADNSYRGAFFYALTAKYFISRYGVPVLVCGMQNENGPKPSPELLRQVFDAGKLYGLKILPGSSGGSSSINSQVSLYPEGSSRFESTDYIGTHSWPGDKTQTNEFLLIGTHNQLFHRKFATSWRPWKGTTAVYPGAGSFAQSFTDGSFTPDQVRRVLDEYALCLAFQVENGGSGAQVWQLGNRTGHFEDRGYIDNACSNRSCDSRSVSSAGPTQDYDPYVHGIPSAVDAAATINPFVRPGMWYVGGSRRASWPGSYDSAVVGFTGGGKRDVIVIYNNQVERDFAITVANLPATEFDMYRALPDNQGRRYVGRVRKVGDVITVPGVPGDSVTSLVAADAIKSRARVILVVGNATNLTPGDQAARDAIAALPGVELVVTGENVTREERVFFNEMRMPWDPMGTACYVISASVAAERVGYAHRSVAAPVLVLHGANPNRARLGLNANHRIAAGDFLDLRDPDFDLPANFLDNGLPRACGYRSALDASASGTAIQQEVAWLVSRGGATDVQLLGAPPAPPAAPIGLTARAAGSGRIDLAWSDASTDETGFTIAWSPDGIGGWTTLTTVGANVTSYADTGLPNATTRHYRLAAFNEGGSSAWSNAASATTTSSGTIPSSYEVPELTSGWWQIAPDEPDVSPYTYCRTLNSSAVDFTIFQAADGTWRLISCVRNICETTGNRLLFQWKTNDLAATFWTPVGVLGHSGTIGACAVNPSCTNSVRAPHGFLYDGLYYLFFDSGGARCLISPDGIDWSRHVNIAGDYKFFDMSRDLNVTRLAGRWQAVYLANPDSVHPSGPYMAGRTAPTPEGPWSNPAVVVRSSGNPESPFIVERNGVYYLWQQSDVFASTDPLDFDDREPITTMWQGKYAPEVFEYQGQWYVAAYNRGIWLARMRWVGGVRPPLTITTTSLPEASRGAPYSAVLEASGGTAPYTWSIAAGALPMGLALNPTTGDLAGTPTADGSFVFTARVTDATSGVHTRQLTLVVTSPATGPTAPSGLTVTGVTTTSIRLAWTDNSANEDGFRVERSMDGVGGWTLAAVLGANATSYTDSGLPAGATRHYRVQSFHAGGASAWSSVVSGTTQSNPPSGTALLYEPFAYPVGGVAGAAGGEGFSGPWTAREGVLTVAADGLTHPDLPTTGGRARDASSSVAWAQRPFNATDLTRAGSILWISFLAEFSSTGSDLRVKFFSDGTSYNTGTGVRLTAGNPVGNLQTEVGSQLVGSRASISRSSTVLVVGRLEFVAGTGNDTAHWWINPPLGSEPALGSAQAISTTADLAVSAGWLTIRGGGSFEGSVDEVRLGRAFASVTGQSASGEFGSYARWTAERLAGEADPARREPAADAGGHGVANLAAFGLGLDPYAPNLAERGPRLLWNGNQLEFAFHRAEPSAVRYILQAATILGAWQELHRWETSTEAAGPVTWSLGTPPTEPTTLYRLVFELVN